MTEHNVPVLMVHHFGSKLLISFKALVCAREQTYLLNIPLFSKVYFSIRNFLTFLISNCETFSSILLVNLLFTKVVITVLHMCYKDACDA